jgi:hypothetical protein
MALVAARLGIEDELRTLVARAPDRPINVAAKAAVAGDHSRAADLYLEIGSPTFEAMQRSVAGEKLLAAGRREEGRAELERALAFYRSVGATAYLRDGDALLGARAGTG